MALMRITRFQADPDNLEELLSRRAALIATIREEHPGLTETCLTRLEDGTWADAWRWDSLESMRAALAAAPSLPAAGAAFSLVKEPTAEVAEIVDEQR